MTTTQPFNLDDFITPDRVAELIRLAREEDLGSDSRDVTSELFVPADLQGEAAVVAREPGKLAGGILLPMVADAYHNQVQAQLHAKDGDLIEPGDVVATLSGPMRSILSAERVALNLITHLSGVATLTSHYVRKVSGTSAKIYDTRKTLPGLRGLQKYAVACGEGGTHRMGLYDAVLLKDNHLSHVNTDELSHAVSQAVKQSRDKYPHLQFVMVEVDTLQQLRAVLTSGVDIVLLDNMNNQQLKEAVTLRDQLSPGVELEASGGVTLETVRAIAETGVDRISVGALTHSAPSLDLGLDIR